jgi:hypothetical protein
MGKPLSELELLKLTLAAVTNERDYLAHSLNGMCMCYDRGFIHSTEPFLVVACDACEHPVSNWEAGEAHDHECDCGWPTEKKPNLAANC